MRYRPEWDLEQIRRDVAAPSWSRNTAHPNTVSSLLLRWLRTFIVISVEGFTIIREGHDAGSISSSSPCSSRDEVLREKVAVQQRATLPIAVQHVVVYKPPGVTTSPPSFSTTFLASLLEYLCSIPQLVTLDLRGCNPNNITNELLMTVAERHAPSLQRLCLPVQCDQVRQTALDCFTELDELHAESSQHLTNVHFCAAKLRKLYATFAANLTDEGLSQATQLEVLHVGGTQDITTVAPFARKLLELRVAGFFNGITTDALVECTRLQVLDVSRNPNVRSLQPFAHCLRELEADIAPGITDNVLVAATSLVSLSVRWHAEITTVAPFAGTLRFLDASMSSMTDAGLSTAVNLVSLKAADNAAIRTLESFAATLLELDACGESCGITDRSLNCSTELKLVQLHAARNSCIGTTAPIAESLRHLVVSGLCAGMSDAGLTSATNLVTFDLSGNSKIATIVPFCQTLEELRVGSESCSAWLATGIVCATHLRRVVVSGAETFM